MYGKVLLAFAGTLPAVAPGTRAAPSFAAVAIQWRPRPVSGNGKPAPGFDDG